MKRFVAMLVFGGVAAWAWWYTFEVDPGGEGFGFETCADGEGVCSDDPSVFTLIVAIIAGVIAFFCFVSLLFLIARKLRGSRDDPAQAAWHTGFDATAYLQQVQEASAAGQGLPASRPGQIGVIGGGQSWPAGSAPQAGRAAAPPTPARASQPARPTPQQRRASTSAWLRRSSSGPMPEVPEVPDVPTPGPTPAAAGGAGAAPSTTDGPAEPEHGTLVLSSVGSRELGVQREVRRVTGMGLSEAKALLAAVGDGPQVVAEGVAWDAAQDALEALTKMGARAEVRPG